MKCWDDGVAADAGSCKTPAGLSGLATIFQPLDDSCDEGSPSVNGKVEVFECSFGEYVIRYSRWVDGFNRYAYFNKNIHNAATALWTVQGVAAGRTWTGLDDRAGEEPRRFRWIGAYENAPYDVTVKGVDQAAMEEGIQQVQAKLPEEIGLP